MNDLPLLVRATLHLYREAAVDASRALARNAWMIVLLPAFSVLLGMIGRLAGGLGIVGGLLTYMALAAGVSAFLSILDGSVAKERVEPADLADGFGRHLSSVVGLLFIFGVIQFLLMLIADQNPSLRWLDLLVSAVLFLACNPLPELVYQGRREGFALVDDAIQFMRQNSVEWLLPVVLFLLPFFLVHPMMGLVAMTKLGPSSALGLVTSLFEGVLPSGAGLAKWAAPLVASAVLSWVMLFRGFLFKSLDRSGRRQRVFEARMRA